MYLKILSLINFKNYEQAEFQFSGKLNCFVGNNGVGKTNLLDAIHYLSLTKSYFNSIDTQNIRHEADLFMIQGSFEHEEKSDTITCSVRRNKKKKFSKNKKEYQRLADHIGLFPVVMISPEDSALVMVGSEQRRKFMDAVISQYDRKYLEDLINYNRALLQRNQLLKAFYKEHKFDAASLALWDEQLVPPGERIHARRVEFIRNLIPKFQNYYDTISEKKEIVGLKYRSQLEGKNFREELKAHNEKDRILQYTTFGVHKDDLDLLLEDHPIRKVGSQGQQKTYLVALKLAKFECIRQTTAKKPILLLDDIFDKFDASRVTQIIKIISEREFGQIFITDTNQDRLDTILSKMGTDYKIFKINNAISEL